MVSNKLQKKVDLESAEEKVEPDELAEDNEKTPEEI